MRSEKEGKGYLTGPSEQDGQMEAPLAASPNWCQHHPAGIRTNASHPGSGEGIG